MGFSHAYVSTVHGIKQRSVWAAVEEISESSESCVFVLALNSSHDSTVDRRLGVSYVRAYRQALLDFNAMSESLREYSTDCEPKADQNSFGRNCLHITRIERVGLLSYPCGALQRFSFSEVAF